MENGHPGLVSDSVGVFWLFLHLAWWMLSVFQEYFLLYWDMFPPHITSLFIIKGCLIFVKVLSMHQLKRSHDFVLEYTYLWIMIINFIMLNIPCIPVWSQLQHSEWSLGCVLELDLQVFHWGICIQVHQPIHKMSPGFLCGFMSRCLSPQFTPHQPPRLAVPATPLLYQPHPCCTSHTLPADCLNFQFSGWDPVSFHPHNLLSHVLPLCTHSEALISV